MVVSASISIICRYNWPTANLHALQPKNSVAIDILQLHAVMMLHGIEAKSHIGDLSARCSLKSVQ